MSECSECYVGSGSDAQPLETRSFSVWTFVENNPSLRHHQFLASRDVLGTHPLPENQMLKDKINGDRHWLGAMVMVVVVVMVLLRHTLHTL